MACNITDGRGRPACPGETPNCFDTFWLGNLDQVTAFVLGTGRTVEDITFTGGAGLYQVIAQKGSVRGYATRTDDDTDATDYTHAIDFRLADLSIEASDWVNDLNGANLFAIVRTKGNKFLFYGYNDGITMKVNNMDTNADELGEFITLRENNVDENVRRFFDTDTNTTLAAIEAMVVGS
jgi:hypothetical protein